MDPEGAGEVDGMGQDVLQATEINLLRTGRVVDKFHLSI